MHRGVIDIMLAFGAAWLVTETSKFALVQYFFYMLVCGQRQNLILNTPKKQDSGIWEGAVAPNN